jgi:hypothetical protein
MKKTLLFLVAVTLFMVSCNSNRELQDRQQLKNLVDTFSVLADVKDTDTQGLLFTEDGIMKTMQNGVEVFRVDGRQNIVDACAAYLALFDTVYHLNGQQTVEFMDARNAKGISYCYVVLIGKNPATGKEERLTEGFRYHDTYVKKNGVWQISIRESEVLFAKTEIVN